MGHVVILFGVTASLAGEALPALDREQAHESIPTTRALANGHVPLPMSEEISRTNWFACGRHSSND